MNKLLPALTKALEILAKVLFTVVAAFVILMVLWGSFYLGFYNGYAKGNKDAHIDLLASMETQVSTKEYIEPSPTAKPTAKPNQAQSPKQITNWSGPQLWEAVNARRIQNGVNPISKRDEICTIASIRLNELLDLGNLDAHEGFSKLPEEREDLKWIYEKYTLTEFLVSGADTATEAVELWENTLGHSKLLTGGEYVWGCTYAQNGFGVAITAY